MANIVGGLSNGEVRHRIAFYLFDGLEFRLGQNQPLEFALEDIDADHLRSGDPAEAVPFLV